MALLPLALQEWHFIFFAVGTGVAMAAVCIIALTIFGSPSSKP